MKVLLNATVSGLIYLTVPTAVMDTAFIAMITFTLIDIYRKLEEQNG